MRNYQIKINLLRTVGLSLILVAVLSGGVFAFTPSLQSKIKGCYTSQNELIKILEKDGKCGFGQKNIQWDRGVLGYAHFIPSSDASGVQKLIIPNGQSEGISVLSSPGPENGLIACLKIASSDKQKIRFAAIAPSTNGTYPQVMIRDKSQDENDTLLAYCTSDADAVFI